MPSRRFVVLAGVLVTLNLVLWLTPAGFAMQKMVASQLFGPKMVRAEVIYSTGGSSTADWRVDRGTITSLGLTQFTITEADGRTQSFSVAPTTQIAGGDSTKKHPALGKGWHVLVTWLYSSASAPVANTVKIEKRGPGQGGDSLAHSRG